MVVVEVAAEHAFYSHLVVEGEDGMFGQYRVPVPLALDKLLVGGVSQSDLNLGTVDVIDKGACRYAVVGDGALERYQVCGNVYPVAQGDVIGEMVVELACICEFCFLHVAYLVVLVALDTQENVVLVGVQIGLSVLENVALIVCFQRVDGEFVGVFLFLLEGVFHLAHVFPTVIAQAVCNEETSEKVRVQVGRCHCSCAQSPTLKFIVAYRCVHRSIEDGRFVLPDWYPSGEEERYAFLQPIVERVVSQLFHHLLYRLFLLGNLVQAVYGPELFALLHRVVLFYNPGGAFQNLLSSGGVAEVIVGIYHFAVGVETVECVHQLQLGGQCLLVEDARTVGLAAVVLHYVHVLHKVHVYVVGHIHLYSSYKESGIGCYVYMSCETERLNVER